MADKHPNGTDKDGDPQAPGRHTTEIAKSVIGKNGPPGKSTIPANPTGGGIPHEAENLGVGDRDEVVEGDAPDPADVGPRP